MDIRREDLPLLLKRYLEGTCSDEERQAIDAWYNQTGVQRPLESGKYSQAELQTLIWQQIQEQINGKANPQPGWARPSIGLWRSWYFQLALAASLLLIGGLVYIRVFSRDELRVGPLAATTGLREEINTGSTTKTVLLDDGSRITLHPGSRVQFPQPFSTDVREVHLNGVAFFDVTKDAHKPFIVYTGEIATKVVGTSFLVRSDQQDSRDVVVSVMTGKVIVERREPVKAISREGLNNGVVLNPNQQVTYYHSNNHFVTSLVAKPITIKPQADLARQRLFRFSGTPLREVLEKLQSAYGLKFELINEAINNCPVTADLTDQPFFVKLDIIAESLNARYEVKGTSIVLSGGNCE
ncbi:hypothetical protein GCM10027347_11640 [Larkinella harenae]